MINEGKKFEQDFKSSINEQEVYCLRIQDNASGFGTNSNIRFTMKPPYDFLLFYEYNLYAIELKSTKINSISFEKEKKDKGKMIHFHQIEELKKVSKYPNAHGGFLCNFRNTNNTWYIDIKDFIRFVNSTDKKSINEKDIEMFNGILLYSEQKRIRFSYDIKSLLDTLKDTDKPKERGDNNE